MSKLITYMMSAHRVETDPALGTSRKNESINFQTVPPIEVIEYSAYQRLERALEKCYAALRVRSEHDEDCADQNEEFKEHESCECGATEIKQALAEIEAILTAAPLQGDEK